MHDLPPPMDTEEWVIWNSAMGFLMMATIGRIEVGTDNRIAWMSPPFEMLGPFNLDELVTQGRIAFAACIVMSRQRWQDDQMELRRESYEARRAAQERLDEQYASFNGGGRRRRTHRHKIDEREHRQALNLPTDGKLEQSQIKKAYRRLAQKMHPDVGGSHEKFIRITEARNALLDNIS
ncbi:MAG: molecular chaperone DnaJ [Methylobacter sp.]|nr:MAG: molecular chaperone DnaJ [Methylobacter sp.]